MAEELKEQQEGQKSAGGQDGFSPEAQGEQSEKQAGDEEEQDEEEDEEIKEEEEEGPRFNFIESGFLVISNLVGDILELFDLSGVGVIVGLLVDFVNGPMTVIYLWLKGVDKAVGKNALAQAAELIPLIDLLPIRTTAIILTIIATNHPEWIEKISGHSELIGKIAQKFSSRNIVKSS